MDDDARYLMESLASAAMHGRDGLSGLIRQARA